MHRKRLMHKIIKALKALAALPILAVVGLFLYARKKYEENPEPLELARRQNGFTPDRKMRRYQKRNQKKVKK